MRLPSARDLGLLLVLILAALAYVPINRHTHNASTLWMPSQSLTLIPAFAVPYLLFLPLFWGTIIYSLISKHDFRRLVIAAIIIYALSYLIYLAFPTYVPRPEHATGLLNFIYQHDRPYCDFPSLHVASATIFAFYWWSQTKKWRWLVVGFSALVIMATLFIKQHSILGVISGLLLAAIVWKGVTIALTDKTAVQ